MKIELDQVKFEEEVYPRNSFDNETVNQYRLGVDRLPPILVNKYYTLIDGYHRWLAYKAEGKKEIDVEVLDIPKEEILFEAIRRNRRHGKQLTSAEKKSLAVRLYDGRLTQKKIADLLSVDQGTVSKWLEKIDQTREEERERVIIDLYLRCYTQKEIANKVGVKQPRVAQIIKKLQMHIEHDLLIKVPESLQFFNVWNFPNRNPDYGIKCEGNIPGQIIENLLYYYTKPFDIVVDPMAGGGTTIDVCKAMYRRYRAYDIDPLRDDIKKHDIRKGFLKECKGCDLIFLDPPYFDMVFGKLFKDAKEFYDFIRDVAKASKRTVKKGGIVALLMGDRTKEDFECLTSECYNIFRKARFECTARISVPLSTESANAREIVKAKEIKKLLGRDRVLYVFRGL